MKINYKQIITNLQSKVSSLPTKKMLNVFDKNEFQDTNDAYRVQLKIIERQSNIIGFLSIICLSLLCVIVVAYPLKEKVPYFLAFLPKDEQITYVEPYRKTVSQQRIEKEYLARMYVKMRETIDFVTDLDNYSKLMFYSTDDVGNEFRRYMAFETNPNSPYKYALDNNILHTVEIISSNMLNENQYQVDFLIIESNTLTRREIKTTEYIATITFTNPSNTFKSESHLVNPLGYRVSHYQVGLKAQKIRSSIKTKDGKHDEE